MTGTATPGDDHPFLAPAPEPQGEWRHRSRWQTMRVKLLGYGIFLIFAGLVINGKARLVVAGYFIASVAAVVLWAPDPRRFAIRWDAQGLTGPDARTKTLQRIATVDFGRSVRVRTFTFLPQTEVEDDVGNRVMILHTYISRADREELLAYIAGLYPMENAPSDSSTQA